MTARFTACEYRVRVKSASDIESPLRRSGDRLAQQSSVVIYTIGLFTRDDQDANRGVWRKLAEATGGEVFFPKRFAQIADICRHIAGDIRTQYSIGLHFVESRDWGVVPRHSPDSRD